MTHSHNCSWWLARARPLLDQLADHCLHLGISPLSITRNLKSFEGERAVLGDPSALARSLAALGLRHRALIARAPELRSKRNVVSPSSEASASLERDHARALESIAPAASLIRDARATSTVLLESLHAAQPAIFEVIQTASEGWQSSFHPLTSPRKHVGDIARQATDCARAEIERWMRVEGARITAFAIERKLRLATDRVEALGRYLGEALALGPDEVRDELAAMQADALNRAFGVDLEGADAARTAATAMAGAVLSAMLGYALADVLLYYILHAVIGFLNPWLLATSLAGATVLYLARGDAFVRRWVRTQVISRLRGAFDRPEHQRSLDQALDQGLQQMLDGLAESFEAAAREAIDAAHQQRSHIEDLEPAGDGHHGNDAIKVLDQLDALVCEIRAQG